MDEVAASQEAGGCRGMKLDINAKELLALYNVLYECFEVHSDNSIYVADDPHGSTDTNLYELYKRVRACILASLGATNPTSALDSWVEGQQRAIDKLEEQNEKVKRERDSLKDLATSSSMSPGAGEEDADKLSDEDPLDFYPRKGYIIPRGKFHGHKQ